MPNCNLPDIIDIKDIKNESLDKAYTVYLKDIGRNNKLKFKGLPVKVTTTLDYNLKQKTFEHIVSKDIKARLYDLNRATKIPWIRHILETCDEKNCSNLSFINDRKNEYCLWCKKENYLIILELRKDKKDNTMFYYLKTAYPITEKDKLKQMYKKEKKQNENGKK